MNFSMPRPGWPCTRVLRLAWFASLMLAACTVAMATPAHDFDFGDRYFESVGSVDDIPYGIVTAIVQDARGMMWLGTQSGLLRFDGYRFRRFKHEPDNPASLSGDFVQSLAIDRTGRIWVGTESDGLAVLDPQTERFRRFRHDPTNVNSIGPGPVHALAMAADGAMWVAADVGLVSMDLGADHFVRRFVEHQQGDAALRVQSLLFAHDGSLWVGARDGLLHRAPGEQIPRRFATVGAMRSMGARSASCLKPAMGVCGSVPMNMAQQYWIQYTALSSGSVLGMRQRRISVWLGSMPLRNLRRTKSG
ncbi:MAG: hypothetical protein IPH50_05565 [Rhodanobacteraceae bacterium]|nr:hypothetical protein [Rhodanobacteraceae bacterium]